MKILIDLETVSFAEVASLANLVKFYEFEVNELPGEGIVLKISKPKASDED